MQKKNKRENEKKIEKSVIDIVRAISRDNNYIYDKNEFSKNVKHIIEGICKIDNLEKWLLYKTETSFSLKLSIWNNETYKFFKGKTQLPPSEDGGLLWSKDHFLRLKVACRLKPVSFATKVA